MGSRLDYFEIEKKEPRWENPRPTHLVDSRESIGEPSNDLIYDRGLKHHDAHSSPKDSIGVKRKFMVSSDVVEARIAKGTLMCWVGESVGT